MLLLGKGGKKQGLSEYFAKKSAGLFSAFLGNLI